MPLRPQIHLLEPALLDRVLEEAFQLLLNPGIRISDTEALVLLTSAGAKATGDRVSIPESLVRRALATAPSAFDLFDRAGNPTVHYGGDAVQFDPGSCAVHILDPQSGDHRRSNSTDLLTLVKLADVLPQFAAQSTACVCEDAPPGTGDMYRLYLVLTHSEKPVVTGAFSAETAPAMFAMLAADAGGVDALAAKPRAIFDVCPSPPLHWTEFASRNLIALARARIPAEIVSMPLAGATAPVTLIGAITQHAAECLAGITLHQLAFPSAPIVWGGAPSIFDMRHGTTPIGAVETAMIHSAYAQVGKSLGLPTHGYLCASDSKSLDAQAGMESVLTATIGALSGINMISGAGMLDFLACQSPEKMVMDAEAIAQVQRLLAGIGTPTKTFATGAFALAGLEGEFLKLQETRRLFRGEQTLPSAVIDRSSIRVWEEIGRPDAAHRAHHRVEELLAAYTPPTLPTGMKKELQSIISKATREVDQ